MPKAAEIAAKISASWGAVVGTGVTVSDISVFRHFGGIAALFATYTTLVDTVARETCNCVTNMLDDFNG
jgi:hypothetical protein